MPRRIALIALVLVALTGCGKKGPLYLPEPGDGHATPTEDSPAS